MIFHDPGTKDTNWSATAPVTGADGVLRRWVYLHYFKAGQPSINWLDPTFAGMRLVIGDALHSLRHLGAGALRLDANGFLGLEPAAAAGEPAWSEGHPLSDAVNQLIASMVRKVGGFTFQELNLAIEDIKRTVRTRRRPVLRLRQSARRMCTPWPPATPSSSASRSTPRSRRTSNRSVLCTACRTTTR